MIVYNYTNNNNNNNNNDDILVEEDRGCGRAPPDELRSQTPGLGAPEPANFQVRFSAWVFRRGRSRSREVGGRIDLQLTSDSDRKIFLPGRVATAPLFP